MPGGAGLWTWPLRLPNLAGMGFMKKAKVEQIAADALKAKEAGQTVFVARYWDEVMTYQGTGAVAGAADAIESVESAGWRLEHTAYAWVERKNRGVQVLTFRAT